MPMDLTGVTTLLQVFDMRSSVAFYRDVLGFEVVSSYEPEGHLYWVMLKNGGASLMLNAKYEDSERPTAPEPVTRDEDVTLYFGCKEVDAFYAELREKGVPVQQPQTAFYGMRQMYLTDLDGYHLCFQHRVK